MYKFGVVYEKKNVYHFSERVYVKMLNKFTRSDLLCNETNF